MSDSGPEKDRDLWEILQFFYRLYPWRTIRMVVLLVFSGMAEGLGFFSLLPVLQLSTGDVSASESGWSGVIASAVNFVGLPFSIGSILILVVGMMVLKAVFLWLAMRELGYAVADLTTQMRVRLLRALLNASWAHFVSSPAGQHANAISSEAHRAVVVFKQGCTMIAGGIRILAYLAVAFVLSWQVAAGAIAVAGITLMLLKGLFRIAKEAGQAQTHLLRTLVARMTEALPGIKPIKAMARERFLLPILEKEAEELNAALRSQVSAAETMRAFQEPIVIGFLAVGLFSSIEWAGEPFASVAVMAALFYRVVTSLNQLQSNYQDVMVGESAFWSIYDQIESAEAMREGHGGSETPPPLADGIEFRNLSFSYGDHEVLIDVSLRLNAGDFVTMVGPSGAGKTTLLDLVLGLRSPTSGDILIDGKPLRTLDLMQWRQRIGYVPQETILFRGSVLDNVRLGDVSISPEQATLALKRAGAWAFVDSHPDGLDRIVGEAGSRLSGGQRQRIAIARALVGDPQLLILDEATTALDPKTEKEVCDSLREIGKGVTVLAVSHQQALAEVADLVWEVQGGAVSQVAGPEGVPLAST